MLGGLLLATILIATIVSFIILYGEERQKIKRTHDYIERMEAVKTRQTMSPFQAAEFKADQNNLGGMDFKLTPRFKSVEFDQQGNFKLLATTGESIIGISLVLSKVKQKIRSIDGDFMEVYPVEIRSMGQRSDEFLSYMIRSWLIEKEGKARMKSIIGLYADESAQISDDYKNIRMVTYFGVKDKRQINPSLHFEIDWDKGTAIISETDLINRQLIINRLMV